MSTAPAEPVQIDHEELSGYEPFTLFDAEEGSGSVKYLVRNDDEEFYFGVFRTEDPLPADNEWTLTLTDHLTVLEGEMVVKYLPDGPSLTVPVGHAAVLPAGSHINLTFTKLPFKEAFVLTRGN